MPVKITVEALAKQLQGLKIHNDRLEKEVRALKDVLNIHDNWNAAVKDMVDKEVQLRDIGGVLTLGILRWVDRYNLCIENKTNGTRYIFNKGSIIYICPKPAGA